MLGELWECCGNAVGMLGELWAAHGSGKQRFLGLPIVAATPMGGI